MKRPVACGQGCGGSTLIEVMLAALVLSILAIAGAAYMYHSRAQVVIQNDKRAALELASGRLEDLRAADYDEIKPPAEVYSTYFVVRRDEDHWDHNLNERTEAHDINGQDHEMVTAIRYLDLDGGTPSYDCVRVIVRVEYRVANDDWVELETLIAP